jgi:hypothetical protein
MDVGRDHAHLRPGGQQRRELAGADRAGADKDHASTAQVQEDGKQFTHKNKKPGEL